MGGCLGSLKGPLSSIRMPGVLWPSVGSFRDARESAGKLMSNKCC